MFSRFYRLQAVGLPFCARLGEEKYRNEVRMIFLRQPARRAALQQIMRQSNTFAV